MFKTWPGTGVRGRIRILSGHIYLNESWNMLGWGIIKHGRLNVHWCAQLLVKPDMLALVVPVGFAGIFCARIYPGKIVQRRATETRAHFDRSTVTVNVAEAPFAVNCALVPHVAIDPVVIGAQRPKVVVSGALVCTATTPSRGQLHTSHHALELFVHSVQIQH